MPVNTLDPKTTLIVIDLQKGVAAIPCAHPMADVVKRASDLTAAFRRSGLPVVLVNTTGAAPGRTQQGRGNRAYPPDFADLLPELDSQPTDHLVTKRTWGAFTGTDLEAHLRSRAVTQVVVCGVATSLGVESTARHAYELGFNVTLAVDAMTDISAEAHGNSVERIFPRLGETGTTQQIVDLIRLGR